ncbi:MAG: M61 family peptidase, partial [Chitinophagaceae bacterium]
MQFAPTTCNGQKSSHYNLNTQHTSAKSVSSVPSAVQTFSPSLSIPKSTKKMLHYTISCPNPANQLLKIELLIENIETETLELQLAAWRPGRYELQNFAQNIHSISIKGFYEKKVAFEKITKDCWKVQVPPSRTLQITYYYYAHQMDAGGTWVDDKQLYVNPVTCFFAIVGRENEPCEVKLQIESSWQIATGMEVVNQNTLRAPNYDALADSPFIASGSLQHQTYTCRGYNFHIWIQGECAPDWTKIIHDFERFTDIQIELFGDFPVPDYHYIYQILPYRHYHGVEHSNSTVCTLGPAENLMEPELYKEFLGVSSHELFHTWNIKKIRPVEMMPYDFTGENYFRTGYVAEGVTTYYGDVLLGRSGVFTEKQYLNELHNLFKRYFDNHGRHNQSVADASYDTWLDGYKPGIPNRKVSIYVNGAMAALILDLEIRHKTSGTKSLDDVMRMLWERFGKTGIGYSDQDYRNIAEEVYGDSLETYFRELIDGKIPHEFYLQKLLPHFGLELKINHSPVISESAYGFRT